MVMPGLSGADVFQALKAINQKVKVILASGYIMSRQVAAVMEQGCRAFIQTLRMEELAKKSGQSGITLFQKIFMAFR